MAGPVDPEKRQQALTMVYTYLALRPGDIIRFDCSFVSDTGHFVTRIDYSQVRKGGYQIVEGDLLGGILSVSPVMGRGRSTPRFPLVPTCEVKTQEEQEAERIKQDLEMEFRPPILEDDRPV